MKNIEEVTDGKDKIAIIIRKDVKVDGIKFFTDKDSPFQIGIHQRKKGVSLTAHIHILAHILKINIVQEILFIQRGKIRVSLYGKRNKLIAQKILHEGDAILFMDGGHGVDFLQDSRIFEVKQGPYLGSENAKVYIKNESN